MRHTAHFYISAAGEVRHVVCSTGDLPAEPFITETGQTLSLQEREFDHPRQVNAGELRGASEVVAGVLRIRAEAVPELRGLALRARARG